MNSYKRLILALSISFFALAISSCQPNVNRSIPSNIQAHLDLANSFLSKNKPRRSLKELLPLKDKASNIPKYHFTLGLTYLQLGKGDKASKYFRRAVNLKPDYGQAWNNLGQAYIQENRTQKAKAAYKRALGIETYVTPEYPSYNLARIYLRENKHDKALKYAQISTKHNWRYVPSYLLVARIYRQKNQPDKAKKWLEKGAEANPEAVNILLELAKSHLRLGNKDNAKYWFNKIQTIAPDSESAQVASDYLATLPEQLQPEKE